MITVYHGSALEVSKPLVALGRPNLDFGQGFYVTDLREQAERWATRIATRRMAKPVLSFYEFDLETAKQYRYLKFDFYDKAWLDFIVANRKGKMEWKDYDVIEGGVANDNVIDTVEDYEKGIITAEQALGQLRYKHVNHQLCILSQQIIDKCLHYMGKESLQ